MEAVWRECPSSSFAKLGISSGLGCWEERLHSGEVKYAVGSSCTCKYTAFLCYGWDGSRYACSSLFLLPIFVFNSPAAEEDAHPPCAAAAAADDDDDADADDACGGGGAAAATPDANAACAAAAPDADAACAAAAAAAAAAGVAGGGACLYIYICTDSFLTYYSIYIYLFKRIYIFIIIYICVYRFFFNVLQQVRLASCARYKCGEAGVYKR